MSDSFTEGQLSESVYKRVRNNFVMIIITELWTGWLDSCLESDPLSFLQRILPSRIGSFLFRLTVEALGIVVRCQCSVLSMTVFRACWGCRISSFWFIVAWLPYSSPYYDAIAKISLHPGLTAQNVSHCLQDLFHLSNSSPGEVFGYPFLVFILLPFYSLAKGCSEVSVRY